MDLFLALFPELKLVVLGLPQPHDLEYLEKLCLDISVVDARNINSCLLIKGLEKDRKVFLRVWIMLN